MDIENLIEIEVDPSVGTENILTDVDKAGPPGLSAYEIYVKDGGELNEEQWLASLKGTDGINGITPTIGNNENWYIGETDTGKPSRGERGLTGATGATGQDGISPTIAITKTGGTTVIDITDKVGTHTATINDGEDGRDGAIQYTAGDNITIDENNVISATGGLTNYLGYIEDYTSSNRLDITNLEKGTYTLAIRSNRLHPTVYLKVVYDNQDKTFDKEVDVNGTVVSDMFYFEIKNPIKTLSGYDEALRICFLEITGSTGQIIYKKYGINYNSANGTLSNGSYYNTTINSLTTDTTQTISGTKTFSTLPESSVVPTSDNQLVNKKYVDDNAGGSTDIKLGKLDSWTNYYVSNLDEGIYITSGSRVKINNELITWSSYESAYVLVTKSNDYTKYALVFNPRDSETTNTAGTYPIKVFRADNDASFISLDLSKVDPTTYTGYDATKTQILKNIQGTLTWVDE